MASRKKARLLVLVTDRAEVGADDFKIGVLPDIVFCHFKHAEVKICDGAERAACYEDDGYFARVTEDSVETVVGESIVWGICEGFSEMELGHGYGRGKREEYRGSR